MKIAINSRIFCLVVLNIIAASIVVFFNASTAHAISSGYFTDKDYGDQGTSVLPKGYNIQGPGYISIPPTGTDKVVDAASFLSFLKTKNGGNTQEKTGSAYILCTMLGRSTFSSCINAGYVNGSRIVQTKGWNQLDVSLTKNTALTIDWNIGYKENDGDWKMNVTSLPGDYETFRNSLYDGATEDVFTWNQSDDENFYLITFKNNGTVVYRLARNCANPVGDLPGIPIININYRLSPAVNLKTSGSVDVGGTVRSQPSVTNNANNGGHTDSLGTAWQITRFQYNSPNFTGGSSDKAPCSYYPNTNCTKLSSGSGKIFYANSNPNYIVGGSHNFDDSNTSGFQLGSYICYALSVQPRAYTNNAADNNWQHSNAECVLVAKHPKVQILGGDLIINQTAYTSQSIANNNTLTFGSWVEYAIYAGVRINGLASGSAFNNGMANSAAQNPCNYSVQSFTHGLTSGTGCANPQLGGYNYSHVPDVSGSFPLTPSTPVLSGSVNLSNLSSGIYTSNGTINITGGAIPSGKWIVIKTPSQNVNISGNIQYSNGPINGINSIPQVVIIANDITIFDNSISKVQNVDSWLIANNVYTCDIKGDAAGKCNDLLTVNGPVIATKLYLRRTGGSTGSNPGEPAERFNLRADAYLWAYARSSASGKVTTVDSTELPPRY